MLLAGHPPPVLLRPDPTVWPDAKPGPPLGVVPHETWAPAVTELAGHWAVLLFTDGLIEGRWKSSDERLGIDGLLSHLGEDGFDEGSWDAGLEATVAWVEEQHGGPLADDVALMLLANGSGWPSSPPGPSAWWRSPSPP